MLPVPLPFCCSGSGPSSVTPAPWEQLPAVQSTTAGLGSLVGTHVGVGCPAGMDAWPGCTPERQTHHLPGGEEMKGWTVFPEG